MRLFAVAVAALALLAPVAWAHGDADWIMADRAYKDLAGTHCCGPSDCEPVPVESATYSRDGWTFLTDIGPVFFAHAAKNLYQTADHRGGRPFICWVNANNHAAGVRCGFWAPGSS
jgi:hypothetical protein